VAYAQIMATRPQTLYGLADSPAGLAAFMLDHGDGTGQPGLVEQAMQGSLGGDLSRHDLLDNITLYWLTGTGASAAGSYWENTQAAAHAAGQPRPQVKLPVGFTTFPGEIWRTLRSWVEKTYPNVTYFHEADRGGHFTAWEEPELFATEIRPRSSRCANDSPHQG
jgi:pimeloyl-ACP methyl ester carboxylesterase